MKLKKTCLLQTSTALHFILYELGVNPDIQEKLYEEIKKHVGDGEEVTAEKLQSLRYLKYVVKEALRYFFKEFYLLA